MIKRLNEDKQSTEIYTTDGVELTEKQLFDYLYKNFNWDNIDDTNKNNIIFTNIISADYRDSFSESTIKEILMSDNVRESFYEKFADCDMIEEYNYILNEVIYDLNIDKDESIGLSDFIFEHCFFEIDYNHYLKQLVCCDLIIDTGDGNYDYTCNTVYNYIENYDSIEEFIDNESEYVNSSSIKWLIESQGYTIEEFLNYDTNKSTGFLYSLYRELLNVSSEINALTCLVKIPLGYFIRNDKFDILSDITINKNCNIGLLDSWNGGGSVFGICLEKPITLPQKFIRLEYDGEYCYRDVYGENEDDFIELDLQ